MTSPARALLYAAQHMVDMEGRKLAFFNPHNKPINELHIIYGFNNGGDRDWLHAYAMAEDGTCLGSHICSSEIYMPFDLGMLEGTRKDRHEKDYQRHYPDGYKMEFVATPYAKAHEGLQKALELNKIKGQKAEAENNGQ